MRIYELIFIIKPDLPPEEIGKVIEQFTSAIAEGGGTVVKVEQWDKRRLAYRVGQYSDGHYVLIHYSSDDNTSLPREIERRLRVSDQVIKYITIRIDEELKRLEKLKKKREKRSASKQTRFVRRPAPTGQATTPESAPSDRKQETAPEEKEVKSPDTSEVS